ncbi:MAG: hypothetical protein ACLUEF_02340 [Faecalibacterium prausnitzii]
MADPICSNGGLPPGGSDGSGTPGIDYQVPAETPGPTASLAAAQAKPKSMWVRPTSGRLYPGNESFDCSGYVCWVYNQAGYDVGRTTANGL